MKTFDKENNLLGEFKEFLKIEVPKELKTINKSLTIWDFSKILGKKHNLKSGDIIDGIIFIWENYGNKGWDITINEKIESCFTCGGDFIRTTL